MATACEGNPGMGSARANFMNWHGNNASEKRSRNGSSQNSLWKEAAPSCQKRIAQLGTACETGQQIRRHTGAEPAAAAAQQGLRLEVVKLSEAKRGFVLLPRRWVVERSFAWLARFRRLAKDYERLPATLAGLHFVAFAILLLQRYWANLTGSS